MMQVYKSLDHDIIEKPTSLALGTFDGVHLGHQKVLNTMLEGAKKNGLAPTVFTFSDVPKQFGSKPSLLMSADEKLEIFRHLGIEYCIMMPFNEQIKNIDKQAFVSYLIKSLNIKSITVGSDFRFGKRAEGNAKYLKAYTQNLGIALDILDIVTTSTKKISSSKIRDALSNGNIKEANAMLGREHFFTGNVKVGKKVGRTLGFATANLTIKSHMTTIKSGVYITKTTIGDRTYPSVSNVGYNPTFNQDDFNIETYILDFNQNIYGEKITVHFIQRIRDELKYDSVYHLKAKIAEDVDFTRRFFSKNKIGLYKSS